MKQWRFSVGQSIVFLAGILVVLILFAGLSIDTGNAYGRQRTIQAGANASSLAGMNAVVIKQTDGFVASTIEHTMALNGAHNLVRINSWDDPGDDPETTYYSAQYVIVDKASGGVSYEEVGSLGADDPYTRGVASIRVRTYSNVDTFFSQVAGVDKFSVSADGASQLVPCFTHIYPMTFHRKWVEGDPTASPPIRKIEPMPDPKAAPGSVRASSRFKVKLNMTATDGSNPEFQWLSWVPGDDLGDAMSGSGSFVSGFQEAAPPSGTATQSQQNGQLDAKDWLRPGPKSATINSVNAQLNYLLTTNTVFMVPIYSQASSSSGSYAAFEHGKLIRVRLLSYTATTLEFGLVDIEEQYCTGPGVPGLPPLNNYTAKINEKLVWYIPSESKVNYDIAVVFDFSSSMNFCWETDSGSGCPTSDKRINVAKPVFDQFVYRMIEEWNTDGGDNRLAVVSFQGSGATKRVDFSKKSTVAQRTAETMAAADKFSRDWLNTGKMSGGTPGAQGLQEALAAFDNSPRRVDVYGKPIELVVVFMTDGLTNVMAEGPENKTQNQWNVTHHSLDRRRTFTCAYKNPAPPLTKTSPVTDDPVVQYNCPRGPEFGEARGPLRQLVEIAEGAQSRTAPDLPVTFFAVVMGYQGQNNLESLQMHRIAPGGNAYHAKNKGALDSIVDAISVKLGEPCKERSTVRKAAGASVRISDINGSVIYPNVLVNSEGMIGPLELAPGQYKISATDSVSDLSGVWLADDPPYNVVTAKYPAGYFPQLYNQLSQDGSQPATSLTFTMPEDHDLDGGTIQLTIDKNQQWKGRCPD